ncbi:MAG: hypothetical protein NT062_32800 [Proteobacteria bacterium]|nr:hypothetical protein [Pseudomonadota bacterium]
MGLFSRTQSSTVKVPRWGFRTGWEDFLLQLRMVAHTYGLTVDDTHFVGGIVPLPPTAQYETWDLRPLATRCRDLDPHEWLAAIRAALFEMYGRLGDVEVVEGPPTGTRHAPPRAPARLTAGTATPTRVVTDPATTMQQRLRVQLFGHDYFSMIDKTAVATRTLGDAWLTLVEDLPGGEVTVSWASLRAAGIDRDEALQIGLANGVASTAPDVQLHTLAIPGAICELSVANSFYLSAVMIATHARMPAGSPVIACALTWHHWMIATLADDATPGTLVALRALVTQLRAEIHVQRAEWIGDSLWWWPPGHEPTPFTVDGELPAALRAWGKVGS